MRQELNARRREGEFNIRNSQCWRKEKKVVWMHHIPKIKRKKISRRWLREMTQSFPRDFCIEAQPRCLRFNRKAQVYMERMLFTYLFEFSFVNIASPARKKDLNWNSDVGLMSTIPWKWNQWCEIPEGVCFSFTNTTLQPLHKLPGQSSAPWQPWKFFSAQLSKKSGLVKQ